ncbi:hypothetical protein KO495_00275 [Colwellia sp. D2M02]|uniref:hypothetical protein n=1 Tax=Colwellia sp. D2M02 TaxID=2841562 RepID=UPI001C0A3E2B|nr:hypothetical protein [Colwellia sp. D2M02]MBU2891752.1 hypothetical protein [Colwellia sp. D2M02]
MSLLTHISKLFSKKQPAQVIGIALQQQVISLCSIPQSQSQSQSQSEAQTPEQSNTVLFDEGKVANSDFILAIEQLDNKHNLAGQAHLVLNASQTQIVQVDKPSVPDSEICAALKWQVKDLVSVSPENMVLDYFDGPVLSGGVEKINVVCAAVPELKKLVATINDGDMSLISITTPEFAFANLVAKQNDACLLVCQQPNEEILILIVKQGQLFFHRRLRGFAQLANNTEEELAGHIIDNLSLEIQRSTDYFERQLKQAPIKELKVLVPIKLEAFFARKLAENTNVPVTLLALPKPYHEQREYAAALGAVFGSIVDNTAAVELEKATISEPQAHKLEGGV